MRQGVGDLRATSRALALSNFFFGRYLAVYYHEMRDPINKSGQLKERDMDLRQKGYGCMENVLEFEKETVERCGRMKTAL